MRTLRLFVLVCLTFVSCNEIRAIAQVTEPQPVSDSRRIVEKIDDNHLVALSGNTLPVANAKTDMGRTPSDLALTDLVLVLSRSPEQQAAFDAFVASLYDPSSVNFHHWLEPEDIGVRFGPSLADIATISAWLTSHGLTVGESSKDRMSIHFSGTASQVESVFHTEIHKVQVNGQRHIANMRDPQIPSALAPVVAGVKALHDFHPRPLHRIGGKAQFDTSIGSWTRATDTLSATSNAVKSNTVTAHPDYGISVPTQGGSYPVEDVTPYDFATIYNVLPLWNASTPIDGTGQTIAIAGTSDINPQDVTNYRSVFGLPAGPPLKTIVANGVDPGQCIAYSGYCTIGDLFENTLDVEVSGAVAKNAQIDLVVSGQTSPITDTVYSSANYVIQNNTAKILSVSYGLCELFLGTSGNAAYNNLWETGAAEGIGIFIATGDSGSPTCDQGLATSVPYGARYGLSVNGLASSAYVTAVGGTDFAWCKPTINSSGAVVGCSSVTPYWNSSNSATTGASAAGYIPEIPWNDSCTSTLGAAYLQSLAKFIGYSTVSDPETACNFIINHYQTINQQYGINLAFFVDSVGGGGGASNCTANSTSDSTTTPDPASCSGGYAKPSWQAGVSGIPSDGKRDIPDLSFFAGNGLWSSATLVCVSATGSCVTSITTNPNSEPTAQEVGGTSVATPQMAGVMALINQKAGVTQGNPNPELYALAAKQSYAGCTAESVKTSSSCYFNDVDTSTIAMPCQAGALNCTVLHSGDTWGILSGFTAAKAFDQATGLGSLNVANVVNNWTSLLGTAPVTITVTPAQNTIALDQSLQVIVTVKGASGTPAGNVTIVGGGYDGGAQSLAAGSYTFNIPAFSLSPGSYNLTGSYQGDSTYAEASGTAAITVNKITPTVSVTLNPTSIGANATITANITVSASTNDPKPTGTVELTAGTWFAYCTLADGACSITIPVNTLPNGTDTVSVSYPGDTNFQSATGSATEKVNALTPAITATASPSSFSATSAFTVSVNVSGTGTVPTGQVTLGFLSSGYYSVTLQGQLTNGKYVFNVPPQSVYANQDHVQLSYAGDSLYLPAEIDVPIHVTATPTTTTVTPSATSIYTNSSLTLSGSVTASSGTPSGYVDAFLGNALIGFGQLNNGQYSMTIVPGTLSAGSDTFTLTYIADAWYATSSTTTTVNVAQWTRIAPTITVTPDTTTVGAGQTLGVTIPISGSSGQPTGTVKLSSGTWSAGPYVLINGVAGFVIPSNTLPVGTDTIIATYSGDPTYLDATATASITVNPSTYSLKSTSTLTISRGQSNSEVIQATTSDSYAGTITLTCALTTSPNGAVHLPTCSGDTIAMSGGGNSGYIAVSTTAPTASLAHPSFFEGTRFGGAALAFVILLGLPIRRRNWRSVVGVLVLLLTFAGLSACSGGGSGSTSGTGGGSNTSGTTPGVYTFTVTGTGNPAVTPAPTATFNVTVN